MYNTYIACTNNTVVYTRHVYTRHVYNTYVNVYSKCDCIYNTRMYNTRAYICIYNTHITYIYAYKHHIIYRFDKQSVMNLDSKLLSILKKDEDPLAVAAGIVYTITVSTTYDCIYNKI